MRNIKIPDINELEQMLKEKLEVNYPNTEVELGESWEIMAKIFYELGYERGYSDA